MNPLDAIEKWISEHGSAAILRDHLALLKGQIAISDREKAVLKSERDDYKSAAEKLQIKLDDARKEIAIHNDGDSYTGCYGETTGIPRRAGDV